MKPAQPVSSKSSTDTAFHPSHHAASGAMIAGQCVALKTLAEPIGQLCLMGAAGCLLLGALP
jgi:hypothetical protein